MDLAKIWTLAKYEQRESVEMTCVLGPPSGTGKQVHVSIRAIVECGQPSTLICWEWEICEEKNLWGVMRLKCRQAAQQ